MMANGARCENGKVLEGPDRLPHGRLAADCGTNGDSWRNSVTAPATPFGQGPGIKTASDRYLASRHEHENSGDPNQLAFRWMSWSTEHILLRALRVCRTLTLPDSPGCRPLLASPRLLSDSDPGEADPRPWWKHTLFAS